MRTSLAVLSLITMFAAGCGITVIVPDEATTSSAGGNGAGGTGSETTTVTTMTTTPSTPKGPDGCGVTCSMLPANQTCACMLDCDGNFPPSGKVSCAPIVDLQGKHKIECVCTVGDQFSGVCFEKNEAVLCDFDDGCCAKYFTGK